MQDRRRVYIVEDIGRSQLEFSSLIRPQYSTPPLNISLSKEQVRSILNHMENMSPDIFLCRMIDI